MKLAGAYINDDTYEKLVALALSNNRTLAGQIRHMFDSSLKRELDTAIKERNTARDDAERLADALITYNDVGRCKAFHDEKDKALAAHEALSANTQTTNDHKTA